MKICQKLIFNMSFVRNSSDCAFTFLYTTKFIKFGVKINECDVKRKTYLEQLSNYNTFVVDYGSYTVK